MDDIVEFPPLLYLICAMSAMSFIVAGGLWFLRRIEGQSYQRAIWIGQIHGFVWAMILSVALGQSFDIVGEVVILIVALAFGYKNIQDNLIFGGLCMLGWIVTVGVGFILFILTGDLLISVFFAGLLWLVPVFSLFRARPAEDKVYNFLWPVLFAYFVLLVPLMIQKNVNTEEWKDRQYSRPLRKA